MVTPMNTTQMNAARTHHANIAPLIVAVPRAHDTPGFRSVYADRGRREGSGYRGWNPGNRDEAGQIRWFHGPLIPVARGSCMTAANWLALWWLGGAIAMGVAYIVAVFIAQRNGRS